MCYNKKDKINNEYINRVNKVQDYIELNLNGDLSLDALSNISGFSKYHFSRIFKGIKDETIYSYINRVRLERALSFVINNRSISITDIAMTFGYSDSAVFARSFRKHFGLSASEVREFF